jgi:hypothetical protein
MVAMTEIIGTTAGKVWQILREQEEADIRRLPRLLDEKPVIFNQALGWLAREGKLEYRERDEKLFVSLNPFERRSQSR